MKYINKIKQLFEKKEFDIIINIILPLLTGTGIYHLTTEKIIRNYLPDGLWSYAFISCILVIWSRQLNILWILVSGLSIIVFEFLQSIHFLRGTGDIIDLATYIIFGLFALKINKKYNS